jgi:hypothetical protein
MLNIMSAIKTINSHQYYLYNMNKKKESYTHTQIEKILTLK